MKFLSSEQLSTHKYKTPEGYLICTDAILARTGKQTYRKSEVFADSDDDTEIEIDRTPEEVFSEATLASFENKPITVEHPNENVSPENYNDLSVGFVRDVRRGKVNGQDVILGTLVITDAKTIEEIENGEHTDLSCGYDCDIIDEAHPQQRNIRGNHVALCAQGRAGIARIVDSISEYNKYKARIEKAIKTHNTELLQQTKEAIMYAPTSRLSASEVKSLFNLIHKETTDSVKDAKSIPSSLINELNRKIEEFKRRGYDEDDLKIKVEGNKIWFTGELSYNTQYKLAEELDKILQKYNEDAYFDAETSGRWFAVYDSIIKDALIQVERYKNVDIYKNEDGYLFADFSATHTGKRVQRLATTDIKRAKDIIDDMVSFLNDSIETIPLRARQEMSKSTNKAATLLGILNELQEEVDRASDKDKAIIKNKANKILNDLKQQFNLTSETYIKLDDTFMAKMDMPEQSLRDSLVEYEYKIIDDVIKSCKYKTTSYIIDELNRQYPGFVGSNMTAILDYLNSKNIKDSSVYTVSYKVKDTTYIKQIKANSLLDCIKKIK